VGADLEDWARRALGYQFQDQKLLEQALTHGSHKGGSYERLEFLGDRVLGCVIAEWLYREFGESEGDMARRFAALVDRSTCAEVARKAGVAQQVRMDAAARQQGINQSEGVLGDTCEALIGALFVDGGLAAAAAFIRRAWADLVDTRTEPPKDPKSALQEWALARRLPIPTYEVIGRSGPDHMPTFRVRVSVRGLEPEEADGASRREAEKQAATQMLQREELL
jgi:ribonuclease-3